MVDLRDLEPEKYYDYNKKVSKQQKEEEIQNRIKSDDYIASLKKDGHYGRFVKVEDESQMQSRTISKITGTYADKSSCVPDIFNTLITLPVNTILIGELYLHGKTSAEAGSILHCLPNKAVARQAEPNNHLYYYIHDCWYYNGRSLIETPYQERIKVVKEIYNTYLKSNPWIECASYATTATGIQSMLSYAWDNDEEGIVMVRKDATVEPGKRTAWKTLKVKRELDKEIDCYTTGRYKVATKEYTGKEIESWTYWEDMRTGMKLEGELYPSYLRADTSLVPVTKPYFYGWAGSIELGIMRNGKPEILGYVSGIDDAIKQEIAQDSAKYVNRPCCVTCMMLTEDGKLRHPKFKGFRDDIDIVDCNWEKVFG